MPEFIASDPGSSFPSQNILFNSASGITGQQIQQNQLGIQQKQLELTDADHEQVARLSAALLNEPDLGKRGDLYSRGVGMLQSQGLAKYAPPTLPDESTLRMLAAQGVSSEKQYEYGAGRTAAQGALGALGIGSTGTGTGTTGAAPAGSVATAPAGTIEPAAFNNATAVRDGLIKRGMDPDTATGAAANALHESVANPRTGRGDNGNAAGIFMWTGPRLQAYIDKTGHPPDGAPLDEQLDFLMDEWKGSEAAAAAKVAAAQGPAAKAAAFSQYFLRPKDTQGEMQRRSATALQLQQQIGGGTTTASTAPTGGVAARTGGTDTAGPGAGPVAPPGPTAAPGGDLMGPRALPHIGPGSPVVTPQSLANTPVPQNGLAPPPSAQAAPAGAPSPSAPGQQPAQAQVPLEPLLDLKPSGLTAQQEAAAKVAFAQPMTPAAATALTAHYQTLAANNVASNNAASNTNYQRQHQAQADAQAQQEKAKADVIAAENLRLSQESGGRDAERVRLAQAADQRAADDAAQKAKLANKPVQGTDVAAQHESYLYEHANEIRDGKASEEVQRQYAGSYYALQQAGAQTATKTDPNNPSFQIPVMITRRLPPSLPEPPGGALPLEMASPGAGKRDQPTVEQGKAATYASRMVVSDPIMKALDETALTWGQKAKENAGNFIGYNLNSPAYKNLRVAQEAFLSGVIRQDSGAAVQQSEWDRYAHVYFPMPGDDATTVKLKRRLRDIELESMKREAGPNWKPPEIGEDTSDKKDGRKPLSAFD